MKWFFVDTGLNRGKFNMDYDLALTKLVDDSAFVRFYRWEPYCISLGANQNTESLNLPLIENDNLDVVKRPTGGRAVFHSEELTYSVIMPISNSSPRAIYEEINQALKTGLNLFDSNLNDLYLEKKQPDLRSFYKDERSTLCFAVPAKSELKSGTRKLVGSAQRKIGNVVLQHGSILCGSYHKNILKYVNTSKEVYGEIEADLINNTIELETLLNYKIDYQKLSNALKEGFEQHFNISFNSFNQKVI